MNKSATGEIRMETVSERGIGISVAFWDFCTEFSSITAFYRCVYTVYLVCTKHDTVCILYMTLLMSGWFVIPSRYIYICILRNVFLALHIISFIRLINIKSVSSRWAICRRVLISGWKRRTVWTVVMEIVLIRLKYSAFYQRVKFSVDAVQMISSTNKIFITNNQSHVRGPFPLSSP